MRTINIFGEISNNLINEVLEQILKFEEEDNEIVKENLKLVNKEDRIELEDITINICSNGGYCKGFYAIHDALLNLKCKKITRGFGMIASTGLALFLIGDVRIAGKFSEFLYHSMSYSLRDSDITHHNDYIIFQKTQESKMNNFLIEKTKFNEELIKEYETRDYWFDYDTAVALGVITD